MFSSYSIVRTATVMAGPPCSGTTKKSLSSEAKEFLLAICMKLTIVNKIDPITLAIRVSRPRLNEHCLTHKPGSGQHDHDSMTNLDPN